MSPPKLIFSFGPGVNFAINEKTLASGPVIKFGMGIDNVEMTSNDMTFTAVNSEVLKEKKPVIELNFKPGQQFSNLKRKIAEPVCETVKTTTAARRTEPPPQKLKSVIVANENTEVPYGFSGPSVFEIGSSSRAAELSKSQKRNRNRKIRKQKHRQEKEAEIAKIEALRYGEEFGLPDTSPLLGGSRFHPLSAARGEENVKKIAASPPRPFKYVDDKETKKKAPFTAVRGVFERLGARSNCSVAEIINQMGCAISPNVRKQILKKERTERPHVRSDFKKTEKRSNQHDDKYRHESQVYTMEEHAGWRDYHKYLKVRRSLRESTELHRRHSDRRAPRRPSFPTSPQNNPKMKDEQKHETPVVTLGLGDRAPSDDYVKVTTPYSISLVRRDWKPKTVDLPVEEENVEKENPIAQLEQENVTNMEVEEATQYVPVDVHNIRGRPVEETLEEIRIEIQKLKERRAENDQILERENKNQDDDVSNEDLSLSEGNMNEDFATVNMVETRTTAGSKDKQVVDEDDDQDELSEHYLQEIRERDEKIIQLEKRMEEMMNKFSSNQPQSSQVRIGEGRQPEVIHINDNNKQEENSMKRNSGALEIREKDVKQMVEQHIKEALAQSKGKSSICRGRPYPEEFDAVQYPTGFVSPLFKVFDGTGNPRQHVAHFRASCCNAGGSDALLFRQFVSSLAGVAFDWYADLPNNSVKTFAELEELFIKRFAGAQHHVTIGDLVVEQQKPNETLVEYILRWRNLSMKCEPQLQEQHAIEILLKSIHGPVAFMLKGLTIKSFEKLLSKAASLQDEAKQMTFLEKSEEMKKQKFQKVFEKKSAIVSTVDKGKQVMKIQLENPPQQQQKPYPTQQFQQRPHQYQQTTQLTREEARDEFFKKKFNHAYPFKTEVVGKMFRNLIKNPEFKLPEPKRPDQVQMTNHPQYCPYHRMLSHTIENCFSFKDWLEKNYKEGNVSIPKEYLVDPEQGSISVISVDEMTPFDPFKTDDDWNLAWSKMSKRVLKKLQNVPLKAPEKPQESATQITPVVQEKSPKKPEVIVKEAAEEPKEVKVENVPSVPRIVISEEGPVVMAPLTLYDFYYAPPGNNNAKEADSGYVFCVLDENPADTENSTPDTDQNINNENNTQNSPQIDESVLEDDFEYGDDTPICNFNGTPIVIELEVSDSENIPEETPPVNEELVDVAENSHSKETIQVYRRGNKTIPPQSTAKDKEKHVVVPDGPIHPTNTSVPQKDSTEVHPKVDYNVAAHLRKIPARLSIFDALTLSKEMRESLIKTLQDFELCLAQIAEESSEEVCHFNEEPKVSFSDKDLLLGTAEHNRPLYISVNVDRFMLSRVLVDPGASINIMNLRTLAYLDIDIRELTGDRMMLRGFNQKGERALGSITLLLKIGNLKTTAKFHIIDSETSFNALLGRPWLHEHKMVPSSLHQCIKFWYEGMEQCIKGDLQPFSINEVGIYEDASYYAFKKDTVFANITTTNLKKGIKDDEKRENETQEKDTKENDNENFGTTIRWSPNISKQQDSGEQEWVQGRGRGRGRGRGKEIVTSQRQGPIISIGLESSSEEDEVKETMTVNKKSPTFSIPFEEMKETLNIDKKKATFAVTLEEKDEAKDWYKTMYDKLNGYVQNLTLTPLTTDKVERLEVKEVCKLNEKPVKFYRGSSSSNVMPDVPLEEGPDKELMELPVDWYSPCVRNLVEKGLIPKYWSKDESHRFEKLWNTKNRKYKSNAGIGFGIVGPVDDIEHCLVIDDYLEFDINCNEDISDEEKLATPEDSEEIPIRDAPPEFEEEIKSTIDELKEVNLGTKENPRPIFVSTLLDDNEFQDMVRLLSEFKDCFAWSYDEMPGLAPEVAEHKLQIDPNVTPVKQAPRRMRLEIEQQVIAEVKKLIEAGFIREEQYPTWLANVVPVKKKNGQIRICVDFRDLNKACPKDEFPLPIPELMIDIASSHAIFSFMDGSSGYNQIKMTKEDEKHTAFRTPIGVYCYTVMPFGLKNAGATYQRAMTRIFDDLIHNQVECYVDDLVVKSKEKEDHLFDLRTVFERLRRYDLKMNPLKCAFGVSSGKFLGFVVRHRGIEIDPEKIRAILEMLPPKNLKQLRSFQGKLAYLRRFISNLSGRCHPFSALVKKNAKYNWDKKCQQAFEEIKKYLMTPPVLAAPIPGRPLILYTAALDDSLGALLAQVNDEGKENALYYLSRRLIPTEIKYPPVEKHCLALIFAAQKLRHYMLAHKINLISKFNPLQYLMTRPTLSGRLARWSMILLQFDITFVPLRAVKGQALADFLAAHPLPAESPLNDDLPDEQIMSLEERGENYWEMYFDGAASSKRSEDPTISIPGKAGIGIIFVNPDCGMIHFSYHLTEPCTNNEAEYEALIAGLEIAVTMEISNLKIYGDSQLIINQIVGVYKILKPKLNKYHQYALKLLQQIPNVKLYQVPRGNNSRADALAKLAKEFACPEEDSIPIAVRGRRILSPIDEEYLDKFLAKEDNILTTEETTDDWRLPFVEYLQTGALPRDKSSAHQIRQRALSFALIEGVLYRRSFDSMWLRCLNKSEAQKIVDEVHSGLCGAHQSGPKMKMKIKRLGYYWPSMIKDCMEVAKKCHQCQVHGVVLHQPPNVLHPTIASWPFECWGTDIVGPIDPPSSKGHRFILAATDYFSKWAEAVPLREVTANHVLQFFKNQIVYRFGVPRKIISDNGTAFKNTKINNFVRRHKIDWRYSTIYYPKANGLAEAFNKTLIQILKKTLSDNKRQWHEQLIEALWAYRTTYRTPTQSTPYALVYGSEAVLPLEVQLPSLRISVNACLTTEENAKLRLEELESLEGKRLQTQQNLELYQAKMIRAHDKLVRPRTFQVGDLVLVLRRPIMLHRKMGGKFEPTWEGPFVIERVYSGGSYQLADSKGEHPMLPINGRYLKKYYAS